MSFTGMQMDRSRQVPNIELPVWSYTWEWATDWLTDWLTVCLMDYGVFYELLTWIQRPVGCGSSRLQEKSETPDEPSSSTRRTRTRTRTFQRRRDKPWTCYGVASDRPRAFNPFVAHTPPLPPSHPTPCHIFPWIMEILWKTLTWTLSLVVMAASEFQSVNRLSHNSQGMTTMTAI